MCKESENKQSTTQTQSIPEWLSGASKGLVDQAGATLSKPFESFKGDRVAEFSGDQASAFQKLRDFVTGGGNSAGANGVRDYMTAGPQKVSTERVVDENGRLGGIDSYMNPYMDRVLTPALQKIQDSADAARKRIGAGATSARAFGDARHGITEADLNASTSSAMGDTAGQILKSGYDTAMGTRAQDLARFGQTDAANAQYAEEALRRGLTGAQAEQQQQLQQIQALLSAGTVQQGNEQANLDAVYQEFLRQYAHDPAMLKTLASIYSSVPYTKTMEGQTTTTTPDNSILGMLGAVGGAALGGPVGASIGQSLFGGGATTTPGTAANGGWSTTTTPAGGSFAQLLQSI